MLLFSTFEEHIAKANELVDTQPDILLIASFGLYAGITADGRDMHKKYNSQTRTFLEKARVIKNVKILVGAAQHISCKGGLQKCIDCEIKHVNQLFRLMSHKEVFPEFTWKITKTSHLKAMVFIKNQPDGKKSWTAITGGRNLTDSSFSDMSFIVEGNDAVQIYKQILPVWQKSDGLDDSTIKRYIEEDEISQSAINRLQMIADNYL